MKEDKIGTVVQASEALATETLNQIGKLTLQSGSAKDKEILNDYLKKLTAENENNEKSEG